MLYFIVETPYEKCFELFFKDELGYPNFYRMNELVNSKEEYPDLILITPTKADSKDFSEKILQKVSGMGIRYHTFGKDLQTDFTFHQDGKFQTKPDFQIALSDAIQAFYRPN
jgi:hypothetical protein